MAEQLQDKQAEYSDKTLQEMLELVRRVRAEHGSNLDEDAVQAIAEVTGTSTELVRVSIANTSGQEKRSLTAQLRAVLLSVDPKVRRFATAAWLGLIVAGLQAAGAAFGDPQSLMGVGTQIVFAFTLYYVASARDSKLAAAAGAIFGGAAVLGYTLLISFLAMFPRVLVPHGIPPFLVIVAALGGALGGLVVHKIWAGLRSKWGMASAADERRELLVQLISIQDRLRAHERTMAFLSLDVVGSTDLKSDEDPLAVEYTFSEYHRFVEAIVQRHGGTIHSTAGDGVICAFDGSGQAFRAARQIQGGLFEFNSARNRLSKEVQLRGGIHQGTIVPEGPEAKNINFSQVIDLASHMQKECPIGGVALSEAACEGLGPDEDLLGPDRVNAKGFSARVWMPHRAVVSVGKDAPPEFSGAS